MYISAVRLQRRKIRTVGGGLMKVLGLVLFVAVLFWGSDYVRDLIKNDVTLYSIFKDEKGKSIPLNRQVYKVFPETQTVLY
jgi:hypothetical protein